MGNPKKCHECGRYFRKKRSEQAVEKVEEDPNQMKFEGIVTAKERESMETSSPFGESA